MSPNTAFPDGRNQAHRNAKLGGQVATYAVIMSSLYDLARLFLRQLGTVRICAARHDLRTQPAGVTVSPHDLFRIAPRPMGVTPDSCFCWRAASPSSSVPFPIGHIFGRCRPVEVCRTVVQNIAVAVSAVGAVRRLRAVKCLANKPVNLSGQLLPVHAEDVRQVTSAVPGGCQYPADSDASMVRSVSPHAPLVRDRIGRSVSYLAPLFHELVLPSLAFNVKGEQS